MDPNTYVLAAVLNGMRKKELGILPPEEEFTPFNLSALRQTPGRITRPQEKRREPQTLRPVDAETLVA